jgi:hypothetical protein
MTVRLHIERLVVDGFELSPAGIRRLRAALEAELGERPAAEAADDWKSFAVPALALNGLRIAELTDAEDIGRGIAFALHGGLSQ